MQIVDVKILRKIRMMFSDLKKAFDHNKMYLNTVPYNVFNVEYTCLLTMCSINKLLAHLLLNTNVIAM